MAPISEKRSQPPTAKQVKEKGHGQAHSHGHSHSQSHTKENASAANSKGGGRGLEILDFHESWLEEMELYKDKMFVTKKGQAQKQSQAQSHPQLALHIQAPPHAFLAHNHAYLPTTPQFEVNGKPTSMNQSIANHLQAIMNVATKMETRSTASGANKSTKRKSPERRKQRVMVRNMISGTESESIKSDVKFATAETVPLPLKRHRDDQSTTTTSGGTSGRRSPAAHSKRHGHGHAHSHSQTHSHGQLSTSNRSVVATSSSLSLGPSTIKTTGTSATTCNSPPTSNVGSSSKANKVIVNQFHASSLLSAHQHEEKTKILTQNGLTKSAATAYETSLYAANYLPQDGRPGYANRSPNADYSNYVGVSLASKNGENERSRGGHDEEDPGAAIDEINEYTDSDSEEEYVGYPFYLYEDADEIHQSRNIRYHPEPSSSDLTESEPETAEKPEYYRPVSILTPSMFPNVPPYLNFTSHAEKGPPMPQSLHKVLKWKLSPVMPKIVKRVVLNSGFRIIKNTTDWMAVWEKHMKSPGFRTIRSHQKYNHMPGSFRIGRKDSMWRSIYTNMIKFGKKEFGFMQKSYIMPDDLEHLRKAWPKNASKLTKWIVKPPASARGTGIRIVNKWSQFPKDRPLVVQKYIERPLLINDNKFDMRIYVIVTSINPLRIYMYKDGLARFASVKYSSELNSLDDRCMHLTNYSINKLSESYAKNEDYNACQGHKWTLQSLWSCLEERGHNTKRLWATLRNLVIKAIISGEAGLNRMYRQNVNFRYNCFELFGFDVLLDENLIPWLLEINISPSLHSELPLDLHVKGPLIQAVLNTALYQVPPKLNEKQQREILEELNLDGPLCHDKRIFTTCLTAEEVRKHNQFTNRSIEFREEYIDSILETLLPDDIRCLIIAEDEFARCKPLERIFPTPDTHVYLKFIDNPRYYNRLLDAWEHRYGNFRDQGIAVLRAYCLEGYHLQVSDAALEKEPNVTLTEIDMLHQKKSDDTITAIPPAILQTDDDVHASKAGSPETNPDGTVTIVIDASL